MKADRGIGRARPAGYKGNPGVSGKPTPGSRAVASPTLLSARDEVDRRVAERVENIEIALAGHAEGSRYPLSFEATKEQVST